MAATYPIEPLGADDGRYDGHPCLACPDGRFEAFGVQTASNPDRRVTVYACTHCTSEICDWTLEDLGGPPC